MSNPPNIILLGGRRLLLIHKIKNVNYLKIKEMDYDDEL
jgi:hypothetical protein